MATLDERDLKSLRWGWGSAYIVDRLGPGAWIAQRRDDHTTLRTESAPELRDLIMADYAARPVPRDVSPAQ